jgi:hypothetical protein
MAREHPGRTRRAIGAIKRRERELRTAYRAGQEETAWYRSLDLARGFIEKREADDVANWLAFCLAVRDDWAAILSKLPAQIEVEAGLNAQDETEA